MVNKYSIEQYDKYICLRINTTLWLILLFLLRPFLVTLISVSYRADKSRFIDLIYTDRLILWWGLLASVPAALVIYAWTRRKPGASPHVKWIWYRGRELLAASAIFNAALVLVPLMMGMIKRLSAPGWIQLGISLVIIVVLYASPYIKDCFSDFPREADDKASRET